MSANKLPTDGGTNLGQNPFDKLPSINTDKLPPPPASAAKKPEPKNKNRGRVDVLRSKAGRGGKTVTVIKGFVGIGQPEKEALAKKMRNACGCGGTVKDGAIEIQGDKREAIKQILEEAGFRVVFAGG